MKIIIDEEYQNTRLDKFIKKIFEDLDLNDIFKIIKKKKIKVNDQFLDNNYRLQLNDEVNILLNDDELPPLKKPSLLSNEDFKFVKSSIEYEDDRIIVFNKKPGFVVHHNRGHNNGLVEILKSYTQNLNFCFINRIDRDTSGLIIGSKSLKVTRELSNEVMNKKIDKQYYILVNGIPKNDTFTIKSYLKKSSRRVIEVDKNEFGAKESISHFKVIKRGKQRSILEATLETGRTHQLRVHLANYGIPIVGDKKYGNNDEELMHLFSHKIVINKYDLEVNLDYPEYFIKNLK